MSSQALRAIPEREEVRLESEEEDNRKVEARLENDKTDKARREVVQLLRTLLAIQTILLDNDDIVTRAVEVKGSIAMAAIPFL